MMAASFSIMTWIWLATAARRFSFSVFPGIATAANMPRVGLAGPAGSAAGLAGPAASSLMNSMGHSSNMKEGWP
jgi:hypothetical protein